MSELTIKLFTVAVYPFIFALAGYFQARGFNVELLYFGAIGQIIAILVQYSDSRKKVIENKGLVDWVLWFVNIVKAGLLAMFFAQEVVNAGWVGSEHLAAVFIGIMADMALPMYEHIKGWIGNKFNNKNNG